MASLVATPIRLEDGRVSLRLPRTLPWPPAVRHPFQLSSQIVCSDSNSYIPRKPHPFGLIQWSVACQSARFGIPIIPYFLWDREGRRITAHEAMERATEDLSPRLSPKHPHWVADSAWGSEKMILWLGRHGATCTFSMHPNVRPSLWECLIYELGVNEGRTVLDPETNVAFSVKLVVTDKKEVLTLKTATTGFRLAAPEEPRVLAVLGRRTTPDGIEFRTKLSDGTTEWLGTGSFISDDGAINVTWLAQAEERDLEHYFHSLKKEKLEKIAESQGWKVIST